MLYDPDPYRLSPGQGEPTQVSDDTLALLADDGGSVVELLEDIEPELEVEEFDDDDD